MSAFSCAEVRDLAPELALGLVAGPERSEALEHVNECGACRAFVGELSEAADVLPLLAAEAEPPSGFEKRVLSALKADKRRSLRRTVAVAAIAAAAVAILSIVGVRVIDNGKSSTTTRTVAAGPSTTRSAAMMGANGQRVGNAFVSDGRHASVVVAVEYWLASGTYTVELRSSGAPVQQLGQMTIDENRGSWGGTAKVPTSGHTSVALVDAAGHTVCEARFPPPS